jgi:hypothetical protein
MGLGQYKSPKAWEPGGQMSEGRRKQMFQLKKREQIPHPSSAFWSVCALINCTMPSHIGEGDLCLVYQLKC